MATIYEAVASAERMNAALAGIHRANFARLSTILVPSAQSAAFSQILASLARMNQAQFTRLDAALAGLHQAHFTRLNAALVFSAQTAMIGQTAASLAKMNQAHFAQLAASLTRAYEPQFAGLNTTVNASLAKAWQPMLDTVLALENLDLLNANLASSPNDGHLQRLSDLEIAVMFTVIVFLLVYISYGLLIKDNPHVARLAAADGPTPFEAAMAAGALVFWLSMNRLHGPKGE